MNCLQCTVTVFLMCIQAEKSVDMKVMRLVYLAFIPILNLFSVLFFRVYLLKINLCLATVTCVPVKGIISHSGADVL